MDLVECLSFLFQISFATLGKVSTAYICFCISIMSVLLKVCHMYMKNTRCLRKIMKSGLSEKGDYKALSVHAKLHQKK